MRAGVTTQHAWLPRPVGERTFEVGSVEGDLPPAGRLGGTEAVIHRRV